MGIVKTIAVIAVIGFFIFYLLGATIGSAQSHPRERIGPYAEYYRYR